MTNRHCIMELSMCGPSRIEKMSTIKVRREATECSDRRQCIQHQNSDSLPSHTPPSTLDQIYGNDKG